jgi:hypothetical protein
VQGGFGAVFGLMAKFSGVYAYRGTMLIEAGILSRYRINLVSTSAVSRYKLGRSKELVKVQDFN